MIAQPSRQSSTRTEDQPVCPHCGCTEIYRESDKGALSVLLLGFPFFRSRKRWNCDD